MLSLIVAISKNNVIGNAGTLPWHLPADFEYFKKTTMHHPIIMGRKTHESIGRALPHRHNIVVTRNEDYKPADGCVLANSIDKAIELAKQEIEEKKYTDEIFIIGGSHLFEESLPRADRLYITEIHHDFEGDTFFPKIDSSAWREISRVHGPLDEKNTHDHDYVVYVKE